MVRAAATVSVAAILVAVLALAPAAVLHAQQGAPEGTWPAYGGDAGSTKYAPLDQIDGDNVERLQVVWQWTSPDAAVLSENDLEVGRTLTYLGEFFLSQKKLTEAVDMHERAHTILIANIGDQHPDVGRSINNLARLYAAQNRLREAADYHTQALAILEPALGSDDPEVKMVVDNLTALYSDIVPPEAKNTPQPAESP